MRVIFWVALGTILVDQVSKYVVVHGMNLAQKLEIVMFPPYLNFQMAWNTGINFGLLSQDNPMIRWVLIGVALAITAVVLLWVRSNHVGLWQSVAAGLLVGGAIGNVIDRLIYGAVADFINMSCCGINNPFVFNVSDIAVFAGAVGLVIFSNPKKAS